MSIRPSDNTRSKKEESSTVTKQPAGTKKPTPKNSSSQRVSIQSRAYQSNQATVGKDTGKTAASSLPKGPSQPSVATKNAGLREKIASLETELQESNDKVKDLEESLGKLAREKEKALEEERDAARIDKAGLQNYVKTLEREKHELERNLETANKEAEKGEEDKKELENELKTMGKELEKLQRDKDQEVKNFKKVQQALEQAEVKIGELNDRCEKVDEDKRYILHVHTILTHLNLIEF